MTAADFRSYFTELKSQLEAKDLGAIEKDAPRGQIFLLFPGANAGAPGRISIWLEEGRARVSEDTSLEGARQALVRAPLEGWLDYCGDPNNDTISKLELYGDLELFSTFGRLLRAKRSAIDVRFYPGGNGDAKKSAKNRRRKRR